MNNNEVAIKIDYVSKTFKLPHEKQTSIKGTLINFVRGGGRSYERQQVLKDVSFEIKKGEFFGIVGRNGSGKSTLLKMLAGIYNPTKGNIQVNGKLTPFIELGVGFNPELTGRENVFLNGALLGFNRKEMAAMYDDIVAFAELERFMDQKLKNYSSGMQVRLAFSIAIRAQSDILVLDEVLAVGDALFQKKCFEYFSELKKQKRTVVFVSHDTGALKRFCDRGVLITSGKLQAVDDIDKIVDMYEEILMQESNQSVSRLNGTSKDKRPARIVSCATLSTSGKTRIFKYKETVGIELGLKTSASIDEINVGIGIYNAPYAAHGDRVFGANTQLEKLIVPGNIQTIRLTIDSPELRNGTYLIYAVVFGQSEEVPYDFVEEIAEFRVQGGPKTNSLGVIMSQHEWEFL